MINISIIIPFKNAKDTLRECVKHVLEDPFPEKEVIIVDDGSDDNTAQTVPKDWKVKHIRLKESRGPAYCRNLGAEKADGELFIFIDSDIMVPAGTINRFAETFRENPTIAAVVGMLSDRCLYSNLCSCYFNLRKHYDYLSIKDRYISALYSSVCGIRKNVFNHYNGFSTEYRTASVEDAEFASRLIAGGEKILLNKEIQVDHKKHHTLKSLLKSDFNRAVLFGKLLVEKRMAKTVVKKKRFFSFRFNSIITSSLSLVLILILLLSFVFSEFIWAVILILSIIIFLNFNFILLSLNKIKGSGKFIFIFLLILDSSVIGWGAFQGIAARIMKNENRQAQAA